MRQRYIFVSLAYKYRVGGSEEDGKCQGKKHDASRAFKGPHDLCITSLFLPFNDSNLSHQGFSLKKGNTLIPNTMSSILGALAGTCKLLPGCMERYPWIRPTTS